MEVTLVDKYGSREMRALASLIVTAIAVLYGLAPNGAALGCGERTDLSPSVGGSASAEPESPAAPAHPSNAVKHPPPVDNYSW